MLFDHDHLRASLGGVDNCMMKVLSSDGTHSGRTAEYGCLARGAERRLSHGALHTNQHHDQRWVDTLPDKHGQAS